MAGEEVSSFLCIACIVIKKFNLVTEIENLRRKKLCRGRGVFSEKLSTNRQVGGKRKKDREGGAKKEEKERNDDALILNWNKL